MMSQKYTRKIRTPIYSTVFMTRASIGACLYSKRGKCRRIATFLALAKQLNTRRTRVKNLSRHKMASKNLKTSTCKYS